MNIVKQIEIRPGERLGNDATVVAHDQDAELVLCVVPWGAHPFVVWAIDQRTGEPFRGSYCESLEQGIKEFKKRGGTL